MTALDTTGTGSAHDPSMSAADTDLAKHLAAKRALSGLSHALEEIAQASAGRGEDVLVVATFQWGAYFAPRAERFARLAAAGAHVIVSYTGPGLTPDGVHVVPVERSHPLVREWSLAVVSASVGAFVTGTDRGSLGSASDRLSHGLEDDRMFDTTWGWHRGEASAHASRLINELDGAVDGAVAARARAVLTGSGARHVSVAEAAFKASLGTLGARLGRREATIATLESTVRHLRDEADRDPLTGLVRRRGLGRWLGDEALVDVPVPRLGVLLATSTGSRQSTTPSATVAATRSCPQFRRRSRRRCATATSSPAGVATSSSSYAPASTALSCR